MIRPAPKADEPVEHQHEIREEEQKARARHNAADEAFGADEIARGLAQHGGDDEGVDDTNDTEDRYVKGQQRAEQKEQQTGEEQTAAERKIQSPHPLQEAVGDNEADVAEGEGGRSHDEIVADQHVAEAGQHKTRRHADVEALVRLLGRKGVAQIDETEDGEGCAANALQRKVKAVGLVHVIQCEDGGDDHRVQSKHQLLRFLHNSPQKHMQELFVELACKGLVAHGQIRPRLLVHDGFVVGEGVEALLAVVAAHAALPHAAEAHLAGGRVDDHVVDTAAAVGQLRRDALYVPSVPREQVERQGLVLGLQLIHIISSCLIVFSVPFLHIPVTDEIPRRAAAIIIKVCSKFSTTPVPPSLITSQIVQPKQIANVITHLTAKQLLLSTLLDA